MNMTESVSPKYSEVEIKTSRLSEEITGYLYILPYCLAFLLLFLGPALYSFVISFARYEGYGAIRWRGLKNYIAILKYDAFWIELGNVMFYWLSHAVPMMCLAFALALLVRSESVGPKLRTALKVIVFMPQMLSLVVVSLLFKNFFGTEYGVINSILHLSIPWLENLTIGRWVVIMVLVWRGTGYWFVIFMAGLSAINPEVIEAAIVDGANYWQRVFRIIIPLMHRTFFFAIIVDTIVTLRMFPQPNIILGSAGSLAPVKVAPIMNLLVESMRNARFGRASAVGWLVFVLIALITLFQSKVLGRKSA